MVKRQIGGLRRVGCSRALGPLGRATLYRGEMRLIRQSQPPGKG